MGPIEQEYGKKGVAFLLVNAFDDAAGARAVIEMVGTDRPWAFADDAAVKALGVKMAPSQILVDKDGKVAWTSSFGSVFEGVEGFRKALDAVAKAP